MDGLRREILNLYLFVIPTGPIFGVFGRTSAVGKYPPPLYRTSANIVLNMGENIWVKTSKYCCIIGVSFSAMVGKGVRIQESGEAQINTLLNYSGS